MRPLTDISDREGSPRLEDVGDKISILRLDYVEPEPVGTIILMPFRIVGYTKDYDGSALATLEPLYMDNGGLEANSDPEPNHFITQSNAIVATADELESLLKP